MNGGAGVRSGETRAQAIQVSHLNIRQSITILVARLVTLEIIGVLLLGVTGFPVLTRLLPDIPLIQTLRFISFSISAVLLIGSTITVVLQWICEYYEIFPDHLVHRKGIFKHTYVRYPLRDITACDVEQGILGQLFNFGTIHLYDVNNMKDIYLRQIHNPIRYFHLLKSLIPYATTERKYYGAPRLGDKDVLL
ncbi:MAG: PH domain-containing protein [Patescibacteria group bacterium]|nr:PH domain-containing protein [Patescibacteria group bacterium]